MEYLVRLTDRALRDMQAIYDRIQAQSSAHAHAWFNGLADAIDSLARHPERSAPTPESKKLRHLLYGPKPDTYRIIYAVDKRSHTVDILHIRHGRRLPFKPEEIR
jgi:plasmid stabilization system protein ParE